ncbi:MAG: hypothetical protein PHS16_00445 [Candidatus Colwellbacteria bacterium]|jgi:hypothetical protein|nr:hypothetical protein [Candidatus Colwellbacteria bacterium]MCK9497592.1 hypothetical protein [Candidatus Colwellbacteria bacterium]MDD3752402.1 hypothetical protein [Candidatus Colwellbacteria bacterium]MDD4818815.1 hypothetical protein [Candidatus Colwellbacteria bacterium]
MKKTAKKIYANKKDSCASVVHKVISSGMDELVLYLPKNALISENIKNFKLLKREASAVGKKVIIESVDGDILEMAATCGFDVVDGIFNRSKMPLMDIMPAKSKLESIAPEINDLDSEDEDRGEGEDENEDEYNETIPEKEVKKSSFKKAGLAFSFIVGLAAVVYVAFFVLPSAEISIERKKVEWSYSGDVVASISSPSISAEEAVIPAQVFNISKNGVYSFPASGSEIVENKATATITIYNAYSSEKQPLVKTTRFVTPEGKIYRITSSVTVPGAKISEGKIIPSSIDVEAVADSPGEGYNTGPIAKLLIPGFHGSPKYDGFYGEMKTGASGGFVGELSVPTEEDIEKAKEEVEKKVREALDYEIAVSMPPGFKVFDGSSSITITKEGVVSKADGSESKGEFSYGMMIEAEIIAFSEDDLISLMSSKFEKDNPELYELISKNISYADPLIDLESGKISIPTKFSGIWARSFDPVSFKSDIIGDSEQALKSAIFGIPGVLSAKADLWPFWVRSVPNNPSKVNIKVN